MNKKSFKMPNAFVIIFIIMLLVAAMTYLLPAGQYDIVKGSKAINPATFHFVQSKPTTFWGFINSIFGGMRRSSVIIMFTFLVGGYFNVFITTKAIDRFIGYLVQKFGQNTILVLPIMMVMMSILGGVGIMANPVVAVVPVGLILAHTLKLDKAIGLAITYVAAYIGYAASPVCPMTVQMAQKIANIPILSGFGFRCLCWLIFTVITITYVMRYARIIQRDPSKSVLGKEFSQEDVSIDSNFGLSDALVLASLLGGLAVYTYGSFTWHWGLEYMAGCVFLASVLAAAIARMGCDAYVRAFLQGATKMTFSALLIGLATSISVLLTDAKILHSLVYYMSLLLNSLPPFLVAPVMFLANLLFNFFVSSGSGQAAVVMPIMAPLADVVGVTRQMAICAFQFGDGLSNTVFPTNGTMMASIAIAGVSFDKWLRWMVPLFLIWTAVACVLVIIGVMLGIGVKSFG